MRYFLTCLAVLFCHINVFAQSDTLLRGTVLDENGKTIPFVNVGVPGCSGTVTDLEGNFSLDINECRPTDTLRISMIGYKPVEHILGSLQTPLTLHMVPSQYELKEVKVDSRKMKEKEKGNFTDSDRMMAGFTSNDLGSELLVRIHVKDDAWVKKFRFYIAKSIFDTLFFRVNVYNTVKGVPAENVLKQPVYVTVTKKSGWVTVDLEKYNIVVEGDFGIGLEWIRDFKKGDLAKGLMFSAGIANNKCFYRKSSQQPFHSISVVGVGFNAVIAE